MTVKNYQSFTPVNGINLCFFWNYVPNNMKCLTSLVYTSIKHHLVSKDYQKAKLKTTNHSSSHETLIKPSFSNHFRTKILQVRGDESFF